MFLVKPLSLQRNVVPLFLSILWRFCKLYYVFLMFWLILWCWNENTVCMLNFKLCLCLCLRSRPPISKDKWCYLYSAFEFFCSLSYWTMLISKQKSKKRKNISLKNNIQVGGQSSSEVSDISFSDFYTKNFSYYTTENIFRQSCIIFLDSQ